MNSKDFRRWQQEILARMDQTSRELHIGLNETRRVKAIAQNTSEILDDLDEQFCKQTGLTNTDMIFLFLAVGLQIARQYLISNEVGRLTASQGDTLIKKGLNSIPGAKDYKDILIQSVPYDAIQTGSHIVDTGLSGSTHRYRTLGHDPVFGWIFGTANILTNSLTKTNFETYQIQNMMIVQHYPLGVGGMLKDAIQYSIEDWRRLVAAVARQAVHFGSDYFTKQGLPVPGIAMVNNDLAKTMLTQWHIDVYSITRGAMLSSFINTLISMMHGLFYEGVGEMDRKLYEVRTRKIISYSNAVATSSNVAVVAVTKDMTKLDVGGAAVTIYRLITDTKFIRAVKQEFIFGTYSDLIRGDGSYLYIPE